MTPWQKKLTQHPHLASDYRHAPSSIHARRHLGGKDIQGTEGLLPPGGDPNPSATITEAQGLTFDDIEYM